MTGGGAGAAVEVVVGGGGEDTVVILGLLTDEDVVAALVQPPAVTSKAKTARMPMTIHRSLVCLSIFRFLLPFSFYPNVFMA